ncbi:MAG: hypothetical protein AAGA48_27185 [Myxococcota bacterium]
MVLRASCLWLLGIACTPPEDVVDDLSKPTPTLPTETTLSPLPKADPDPDPKPNAPTATGDCEATDHPLVFRCRFEMSEKAPLRLTVTSPTATERTFERPAAVTHELLAWGLEADTTYTWTVSNATGSLTTGLLPTELNPLTVDVQGTLFGTDAVLVYVGCGYFLMIESDGDVVWFGETDVYDFLADGMMWSQETRTVLALRDSTMSFNEPSKYEEIDLLGQTLLELNEGVDFDARLTHDIGRWQGYTYLLAEDQSRGGGFLVYDGPTFLGQWSLLDDFVTGNSHVNGLTVSTTGEVVISDLTSDTIVAVDGDPASPTFLKRLWHASGGTGSNLPDPDYEPVSGILFDGQHNASRHGDELWVFDNRSQGDSRALRMAMDHVNGKLTEIDSWSMNRRCNNQGGAMPLPGGVLATCANTGRVLAFADGSNEAEWAMLAECQGAGMTRAFPVTIN